MAVLCREHDYYNVCICNGNVYFELPVCNSNLFNSKTNLVYRFTIVLDINSFNQQYGTNMSVPGFLNFLSPYGQAIFIIYFPFNFIKGIISAIVYYIVRPIESKFKEA